MTQIHLGRAPDKYDPQDQNIMRKTIESALTRTEDATAAGGGDFNITNPQQSEVLIYEAGPAEWQNGFLDFDELAGTILDGQVPESAVTQHEAALSLLFTQLTDQIADAQVPESAVTQHEAALSLLFTQLTDQIADAQVPESAVTQHEAALTIDFTQLTGIATRVQLPSEIAYEDEANTFTMLQTFGGAGLTAGIVHADLDDLVIPDDHTQYFLLAGRAGGQTAYGGTAVSERMVLQGSSDAGLGQIEVLSPINIDVDWNDTSPGADYIINYQPTILSSGGIIEQFIYMRPNITVDAGLFIISAIRDLSQIEWTVNPTFAISTLLFAQPSYSTSTPGVRPANAITFSSQATMANNGAGAGITVGSSTGLQFSPIMRTFVAGDVLTVSTHTGLRVSPIWGTVNLTTVDFGIIRGLHCSSPVKGAFFPTGGVETMQAYYGLYFDNITFAGTGVPKAVVYSLLAPAANAWFLYNNGSGGVGADSYFGYSDCLWEDGYGIVMGGSQDIKIDWAGTQLRMMPASGQDLRWQFTANEVIWRSVLFGFDKVEMLFGFHKFAFGQTSAVGNHIGSFVAAARVTDLAGEWSDFHLSQAGNLTIDHAMSNVAAWLLAPIGLTAGTGSISGYVSTFVIQGMTTSGLGGQPTHAFHQTGRHTLRGVHAFEPLSPSALTADVNNYAPATGNSMRQVWRVTTDGGGPYNVTGIAVQQDSDTEFVINIHATDSIVLQHQNASSTATNRMISPTGADLTLGPNEYAFLWHDVTTDRWRILDTNGV